MKRLLTLMAVVAIVALVGPAMAQWIPVAPDPGLWPYGDGPSVTPAVPHLTYRLAGAVGPNPLEGGEVQLYSIGGVSLLTIPNDANTDNYWGNRQSRFGMYSPGFNSWVSADGTTPGGIVGYNNGSGAVDPTIGQGTGYVMDQGFYYNGAVYVFGGYPRWDDRMDKYDIATNSWSSVAHGTNDGLYMTGGGLIGSTWYKVLNAGNLMAYDCTTDTFMADIAVAGLPVPQFGAASGVIGSRLYIADTDAAAGKLYEIDPGTASFAVKASAPIPVREAGSVVWNGKLYLLGGRLGALNTQATDLIQIYDPVLDQWFSGSIKLPSKRSGFLAEVIGDTLYVGNGLNNLAGAWTGVPNDLWTLDMNLIALMPAAVPEPGMMALMGIGLLSLLGLKRRKK
jgi:hypothetical protein